MNEATGTVVEGTVIEVRNDKYVFDLDDGRNLIVNITAEGVIMDVWGPHTAGTEAGTDNETGINASHLGTVGMMFDEWADWVMSEAK